MYHKREWLNPKGYHSFSAVEAFHGKKNKASIAHEDDPEKMNTLFIIHGCSETVYLHDFENGTEKLRILARMATEFADYLDSLKLED
jgi:hypothetical protein